MLLIIWPFLLIVTILLLIFNEGAGAFFLQERPGYKGKPFKIIKFKTMNEKKGSDGKLLPDVQRITKFGRFVRNTSIDELPQLINVLKGDMAIIGPRPLLMQYLPLYSAEQSRRHDVRPGITGWAQCHGRNNLSWTKKFELDVWYVDHISFITDVKVVWTTAKKVVLRKDIENDNVENKQFTTPLFNGKINDLSTPCFILDPKELERSVCGFQEALNSKFGNSIVGYSVKTNSVPFCLKCAGKLGAYAEVVSSDEYELALACGFDKDNIIYNGPLKSKETFIDAILHGAIVNIETKRELSWLKELPHDKKYNVGLRVNINISHVSPEDADGENDNSRFGFSDETEELKDALSFIEQIDNVELAGLHIHRTTHSRSVRFYKNP